MPTPYPVTRSSAGLLHAGKLGYATFQSCPFGLAVSVSAVSVWPFRSRDFSVLRH